MSPQCYFENMLFSGFGNIVLSLVIATFQKDKVFVVPSLILLEEGQS